MITGMRHRASLHHTTFEFVSNHIKGSGEVAGETYGSVSKGALYQLGKQSAIPGTHIQKERTDPPDCPLSSPCTQQHMCTLPTRTQKSTNICNTL